MMRMGTERAKTVGVISDEDKKMVAKIKKITSSGSDAEIRRRKDGTLTVYEVKKSAVQ